MNFENLTVWKRSARLSAELYTYFRDHKDFGYKDQITRSGLSIPSNIAEGITRESTPEKCRFLNIAYGSCAELRTQIYIGTRIEYIDKATSKAWLNETKEISIMLNALKKSLK